MILVDAPHWPARGRLWSHLVSDLSYAELHAFAEMVGAPRRAFDRDHYDIPEIRFRQALWLGATLLPSRELVARLRTAGLRRPKHLNRPLTPRQPIASTSGLPIASLPAVQVPGRR